MAVSLLPALNKIFHWISSFLRLLLLILQLNAVQDERVKNEEAKAMNRTAEAIVFITVKLQD